MEIWSGAWTAHHRSPKASRRLHQWGQWSGIMGRKQMLKISEIWTIGFDTFALKTVKFTVISQRPSVPLVRRDESTSCIFDMGWGHGIPELTPTYHMIMLLGQFNIKKLSYEMPVSGVCPCAWTQTGLPGHLSTNSVTWTFATSDLTESQNSDPNTLTDRNILSIWRLFLVHFTALSGE